MVRNQCKQPSVTLMIRAKINGKWGRFKAVYGKTGRVIPGLVIVENRELRCSDVAYELRFYKDGKPQYRPVGKNATDAEEQRRTLATRLSAKLLAKSAGVDIELDTDRKVLKQWASTFIEEQSAHLGSDQLQRTKYVIALFFEVCRKTYIDELSKSDIIGFLRHLSALPRYRSSRINPSQRAYAVWRRKKFPVKQTTIGARTIFTLYMKARKWLVDGGVNPKIFPPTPKYEEPEVTIYSPEQIKSLFATVKGNLRIGLNLMLKCGLRKKEVAFAYFSDVNFDNKTILVKGKPDRGFRVKTGAQRYVPVPDDLLEELRHWEAGHPGQELIIQTDRGFPELHLIMKLKRFVYVHGLCCGRCHHCRSGNAECEEWELHKFRRTYITGILRYVDLRTAQQYAGHTRISSTERYLRSASAAEGQSRVSRIDWTVPYYN